MLPLHKEDLILSEKESLEKRFDHLEKLVGECVEASFTVRKELREAKADAMRLTSNYALLSMLLDQKGILPVEEFVRAQDELRIERLNARLDPAEESES